MAQQTAVEWLFQKMTEKGTNPYWDMRFIQAKQMEKEQIITAASIGILWGQDEEQLQSSVKFGEEYYDRTFTSTPQGENPSAKGNEQS